MFAANVAGVGGRAVEAGFVSAVPAPAQCEGGANSETWSLLPGAMRRDTTLAPLPSFTLMYELVAYAV